MGHTCDPSGRPGVQGLHETLSHKNSSRWRWIDDIHLSMDRQPLPHKCLKDSREGLGTWSFLSVEHQVYGKETTSERHRGHARESDTQDE